MSGTITPNFMLLLKSAQFWWNWPLIPSTNNVAVNVGFMTNLKLPCDSPFPESWEENSMSMNSMNHIIITLVLWVLGETLKTLVHLHSLSVCYGLSEPCHLIRTKLQPGAYLILVSWADRMNVNNSKWVPTKSHSWQYSGLRLSVRIVTFNTHLRQLG